MSIASRIEAIEQHLTDDYNVLEVAGADLTNVNKNILNLKTTWQERLLYFMNNGTDVVWNNWDKVTGEGTSISLNNTLEGKMKIVLKGNTSQEGTPTPETPQDIHVVSGDNSINVCGKNMASDKWEDYTYTGNYAIFPITLEQGATYKLSATRIGELKPNYYNYGIVKDGTSYNSFVGLQTCVDYATGGVNQTITINVDRTWTSPKLVCYVQGNPQSKFEELMTNFHIQFEKAPAKTDYEPYQSASYPINLGDIELCKIGTYQDKIDKSSGKNLFDKDNATTYSKYINSTTGELTNESGSLTISMDVSNYQGKNITISKIATNRFRYAFYTNDTFGSSSLIGSVTSLGNSATTGTTIIPNNANYMCVQLKAASSTITDEQCLNSLQIEEGTTATEYEPYGTGWYVKKEIGKVVLDGSESWSDFSVGDTNFRCQYDVALPNILTPPTNPAQLFSNYFKAINRDNAYAKTEIGIAQYGSTLGKVFICAPNNILSGQTLASWKNWLSTHNTIVYYVLATPTYTEITDSTLLSQLNALAKSYNSQTNISQENNDLPFIINATALKEMA